MLPWDWCQRRQYKSLRAYGTGSSCEVVDGRRTAAQAVASIESAISPPKLATDEFLTLRVDQIPYASGPRGDSRVIAALIQNLLLCAAMPGPTGANIEYLSM